MKWMFFVLLLVLVSACANVPAEEGTKTVNTGTSPAKEPKEAEEVKPLAVVTACEDPDGNDPNIKGKVTLYYDDDTKESKGDYCVKEDPSFQVETICDGNVAKEKLNKCANNSTCDKGVCI